MKFILYKLILNIKWFCSSVIRCFAAALLTVLPAAIPTIYPGVKVGGLEFFPTYMVSFFAGMVLVFTIMLRVLGFLFKKIHPPLNWKKSNGKAIKQILNVLLILPFIGLIGIVTLSNSSLVDLFLLTEISVIAAIVLILLNRRISNEDLNLANSQPKPITAENMTPNQLKGMRIAAIIQAILSITFMVLYFKSDMKTDQLEYELINQKNTSESIIEDLQAQVNSLTEELRELKQDTIPNMN